MRPREYLTTQVKKEDNNRTLIGIDPFKLVKSEPPLIGLERASGICSDNSKRENEFHPRGTSKTRLKEREIHKKSPADLLSP